ncbi:hypothetical protein OAU93_00870 [bacterium]|nr:hypothetical protein [bacterium]
MGVPPHTNTFYVKKNIPIKAGESQNFIAQAQTIHQSIHESNIHFPNDSPDTNEGLKPNAENALPGFKVVGLFLT